MDDYLTELFSKKLDLEENVPSKQLMNCLSINSRIEKEICNDTLTSLSDNACLEKYKQCDSLKNKIKALKNVLTINNTREDQCKKIIDDYTLELIAPGLKGVIRGNKFNEIVKQYIISLNLDKSKYKFAFEEKTSEYETSEIPDWYIMEKESKKLIIGMNQLDLWGGGQQINRGSKYIINFPDNSDNLRLVCVVANHIKLSSEKNKTFALFQKGFQENTLCYLKNLKTIIYTFFRL